MTKRNEQMQRMAEQYWRRLESGGMAYELAPQTLVVGSFRDGLKSGLAAHRAEILKLERENVALRKTIDDLREQLCNRNAENAALREQIETLGGENRRLRQVVAAPAMITWAMNGKEAQP